MPVKQAKICKTCGSVMKLRPAQVGKQMCTKCAYDIKKIRSSERYWGQKSQNSIRHKYWRGRLQLMEKMLKN